MCYKMSAPLYLIRDQERKVGPDGFLDSNRFSHTYSVKKERDRMRASTDIARPSVVKLSAQIEQDKKDHDKRIKIIEVCMLYYKFCQFAASHFYTNARSFENGIYLQPFPS